MSKTANAIALSRSAPASFDNFDRRQDGIAQPVTGNIHSMTRERWPAFFPIRQKFDLHTTGRQIWRDYSGRRRGRSHRRVRKGLISTRSGSPSGLRQLHLMVNTDPAPHHRTSPAAVTLVEVLRSTGLNRKTARIQTRPPEAGRRQPASHRLSSRRWRIFADKAALSVA